MLICSAGHDRPSRACAAPASMPNDLKYKAIVAESYRGVQVENASSPREPAYPFISLQCGKGAGCLRRKLRPFHHDAEERQHKTAHYDRCPAIARRQDDIAKQLPEYDTVRAMYGVGETTAAQLMDEIGDVRRFPRRSSIVGFAGVDPGVDDSGKHSAKSVPTTKLGSPHLRKTLYQIICTYLKKSPADEPVYQFLDKKRTEGKPYFVYMTAAQNKFLRIYYARVKECLEAFDAQQSSTHS